MIDEDGMEVIGANISIKNGKGIGTITDLDGKYSLKVNNPSKDILVFSFIGMRSLEVPVKNKKQIIRKKNTETKPLTEKAKKAKNKNR